MTSTVLVIEDNQDNLDLMVYIFKQFGHRCLTAMDGESGLKIAQNEVPDLIICDVGLPKLNGFDFAKRIKANNTLNKIPLIAVTAFSMVGDQEKILSSGFDFYIAKPIEPEIFYNKVKKYLKKEVST